MPVKWREWLLFREDSSGFISQALLAACVSIIIEKKARLACILLGVLLLIYVLSIHLPGVMGGQMQPSMTNLLKDLALAGGAWFIAGSYETEEEAVAA